MDSPILGSTKPQILRSPLGSWRVVMLCDGLCLQPTSHGLTHWIRRKILTSPWITQDQLWQFSNLWVQSIQRLMWLMWLMFFGYTVHNTDRIQSLSSGPFGSPVSEKLKASRYHRDTCVDLDVTSQTILIGCPLSLSVGTNMGTMGTCRRAACCRCYFPAIFE